MLHLIVEGWNITLTEISVRDGKPVTLGVRNLKIDANSESGTVRIVAQGIEADLRTTRVTTWPMVLLMNGKPIRTYRIAVHDQDEAVAVVRLEKIGPLDTFTVDFA